jgi:thioredoxin reductase (NADPH)
MSAIDRAAALAAPVFTAPELADLASFGAERPVAPGEILFRAGDASFDLHVVLEGEVEVVRVGSGQEEAVIATFGPGEFVGELTLLTGQVRYMTGRVKSAGRVLVIEQEPLRELMARRPALSDKIFAAMVARRERLRRNEAASAINIIGSRFSPEAMRLREFADHAGLAYSWIDLEATELGPSLEAVNLAPEDTPAVVMPNEILRRATPAVLAQHLGLAYKGVPGYVFDLVVVGMGPAGLAAAVYGASEGLRTVALDAVTVGGQAGASSRIENYMGFPKGISGTELTSRAATQAMRLGARMNAPCEVVELRGEQGFHVLRLGDGSEIPARSVIVATGARYRRLPIEDLSRFEDAGVYYAATERELAVCGGGPAVVVGGGNSAGQAAIYLSQRGCPVTIAVRGKDLAHSMSRYLIERIEAAPGIEVRTGTEVRALGGEEHLERATLVETASGAQEEKEVAGLFSFIGAQPAVDWLGDGVERDRNGFVLTDRDIELGPVAHPFTPLPFETSRAGVFAAGDVRSGSVKRVAAAAGEGSSAVRSIFSRLSATAG